MTDAGLTPSNGKLFMSRIDKALSLEITPQLAQSVLDFANNIVDAFNKAEELQKADSIADEQTSAVTTAEGELAAQVEVEQIREENSVREAMLEFAMNNPGKFTSDVNIQFDEEDKTTSQQLLANYNSNRNLAYRISANSGPVHYFLNHPDPGLLFEQGLLFSYLFILFIIFFHRRLQRR